MLQHLRVSATRARRAFRRLDEERGITGLETAIILIAFVVVAAVFAFVVLSTGLFSSERSREAVYAGLAKTRNAMTLSSSVVGISNAGLTQVDSIEFDLTLAAGGENVNLDSAALSNSTVISYVDDTTIAPDIVYTATPLVGDADLLLEPGELMRISVSLAAVGATVGPNYSFTIEIKPPTGSYMVLHRQTPAALEPVMLLN